MIWPRCSKLLLDSESWLRLKAYCDIVTLDWIWKKKSTVAHLSLIFLYCSQKIWGLKEQICLHFYCSWQKKYCNIVVMLVFVWLFLYSWRFKTSVVWFKKCMLLNEFLLFAHYLSWSWFCGFGLDLGLSFESQIRKQSVSSNCTMWPSAWNKCFNKCSIFSVSVY